MSASLSKCGYCHKSCIEDVVLTCNECEQSFHATSRCTKLSQKLIDAAETYKWDCPACKRCEKCKDGGNEKNMIFCDSCDRGYHIGCLKPALDRLPDGQWKCPICIRQRREVSKLLVQRAQRTLKRRHSSSSAGPTKTYYVKQEPLSPPVKLMKMHKKYKAALEKHHSVVTHNSPNSAGRKGFNRNTLQSCPVVGCSRSGHLSIVYETHSFKEACPMYHNLSVDELKEFNTKKVKLDDFKTLKVFKPELVPNTPTSQGCYICFSKASFSFLQNQTFMLQQIPNSKQERLIADLVKERNIFDASLRDKMSRNSSSSLLNFQITLEPSLDMFASEEDIALFRMAQISTAEDMEKNSSLRNLTASSIKSVRVGPFDIETVNASCYPDDVKCLEKIFVCHFCLKYLKSLTQLQNHLRKCTLFKPPGKLVYKKKILHIWLVDGAKNKGHWMYNRQEGTGCVTIHVTELRGYVLSKFEDKIGSPEHPLSDMGLIAYRGYWKEKITEYLDELDDQNFSVRGNFSQHLLHEENIPFMLLVSETKTNFYHIVEKPSLVESACII